MPLFGFVLVGQTSARFLSCWFVLAGQWRWVQVRDLSPCRLGSREGAVCMILLMR